MRPGSPGPGALLVVLHRRTSSTDVLLFSDAAGDLGSDAAGDLGLPVRTARAGRTQWQLAEDLLRELGLEARRLYASTVRVHRGEEVYGIFVAFLDDAAREIPSAGGEWMDLRRAGHELAPLWGHPLSTVRERFVARSPDEALRVR